MPALTKKGPTSARSETVAVRLDAKVRHLVELAARDQQRSLSSLVETIIRKALSDGSFAQAPNYGLDITKPAARAPMWGEGFWDTDPADRLYLLATGRPDLMTEQEAGFWKLSSGSLVARGERLTLDSYRAAYHHAAYDKTHLEKGDDA
ncbi:hypothetical protein Terro_1141 [Terriglobus roseus DSM 18391]|uniref:Uncharacterized protein n=1 Tax=Terriglobus roseus (strain DSM 18391 / NRRL B-41598 / KBS 63) TaxID=926566 RepID=I3ZDZ1_TERRK|nr:hypothetical protein [Terriglobus roseus]AFL87459.1 hypothetical protein Terro_1141 [Terriglobus roseus DSM 18391]